MVGDADDGADDGPGARRAPCRDEAAVETAAAAASDADDDDACAVCMEPWTSAGAHRVAALRCGHLFGLSCARAATVATGRCPLCNEAAAPDDAVALFVSRVTAADGAAAAEGERVAAAEAAARRRAEAALAKARAEVGRLRARVGALAKANARLVAVLEAARGGEGGGGETALPSDAPVDGRGRPLARRQREEKAGSPSARPAARPRAADDGDPLSFTRCATVPLGGTTALAADAAVGVAVVCCGAAAASASLRRVSLLSPSLSPATRLPLASVRDVALAPDAGSLLALAVGRGLPGGSGGAAAVVDARCGVVAASLAAPFPALTGAWHGPHGIALGLTNGSLALLDVRRPGAAAAVIAPPPAPPRPVHTLRPLADDAPPATLLAATAAGAWLWSEAGGWAGHAPTATPCFAAAAAPGSGARAALAGRAAPADPPALTLVTWPEGGGDVIAIRSPHTGPFPSAARGVAVVARGDSAAAAVATGRTVALWRLGDDGPPVLLPSWRQDVVALAGGGGGVLVAATAGEVSVARWR